MKKYICLFILLVSVLGLLISCNGKQHSLDGGQAQADAGSGADGGVGVGAADGGAADGGAAATVETGAKTTDSGATTAVADPTGGEDDAQQEEPKVTFSEIQPLFQKHCAYCHVPGAPPQIPTIDWVDYAVAKSYVDSGVLYERMWTLKDDEEKGMPLGNGLDMTEEERQLIVNWIEDGGLQ